MQCVVIHSWENGIIRQLDAFDTGMETADDTAYGGMVGALIGIIGDPLGMLLGGSMGALMGSMVDMDDSLSNESLIEKVMDVCYTFDKVVDACDTVAHNLSGKTSGVTSQSDRDLSETVKKLYQDKFLALTDQKMP